MLTPLKGQVEIVICDTRDIHCNVSEDLWNNQYYTVKPLDSALI